jgi:hypothetical protein
MSSLITLRLALGVPAPHARRKSHHGPDEGGETRAIVRHIEAAILTRGRGYPGPTGKRRSERAVR